MFVLLKKKYKIYSFPKLCPTIGYICIQKIENEGAMSEINAFQFEFECNYYMSP